MKKDCGEGRGAKEKSARLKSNQAWIGKWYAAVRTACVGDEEERGKFANLGKLL